MALTTFVSQNLGAKQYDRAKKGARFGVFCSITIAELIGIIIYVAAPVLITATLIIPKDAGMEFKELEQMVQEVNQTQVAPGERLSDHVYEYDAKEHELFRSDRAEERAKQKEEKGDNRHERVSVKEKLAEKKKMLLLR